MVFFHQKSKKSFKKCAFKSVRVVQHHWKFDVPKTSELLEHGDVVVDQGADGSCVSASAWRV